jgi:ammonia channel protein AmtB
MPPPRTAWPSWSRTAVSGPTQLKAIGVTLCMAVVGTTIIAYIVRAILGLRVAAEVEVSGLDLSEHGEEGYHAAGQL